MFQRGRALEGTCPCLQVAIFLLCPHRVESDRLCLFPFRGLHLESLSKVLPFPWGSRLPDSQFIAGTENCALVHSRSSLRSKNRASPRSKVVTGGEGTRPAPKVTSYSWAISHYAL